MVSLAKPPLQNLHAVPQLPHSQPPSHRSSRAAHQQDAQEELAVGVPLVLPQAKQEVVARLRAAD